ERRVPGYPTAHGGATIAVCVLAGVLLRAIARPALSGVVAAAVAGVVLGTAAAAATAGLGVERDRQLLAAYGDQSRDLVRLGRWILDLDRDGSSALLGGGDCDDLDAARHPGAIDVPGDGIDQDCDGADAIAVQPAPAAKAAL